MAVSDVQRLMETGLQFARGGQWAQAETALRAALEKGPRDVMVMGHLSGTLLQLGRMDEAVGMADRALAVLPGHPALHFLRGNILKSGQRYAEAVVDYERAVRGDPRFVDGWLSLGFAKLQTGDEAGAEGAWRQAIVVDPGCAEAHTNLAAVLLRARRAEESIQHCRRAVELRPNLVGGYGNLGNTLVRLGRMDEAIAAYRKGWDVDRTDRRILSGLVFSLQYRETDPVKLRAPCAAWDAALNAPIPADYLNDRNPERRLRIGYVSPDFKAHAVSFFLESLLAAHNRGVVELFCYAEVERPDAVTAKYQALADHWCQTTGMTDLALAERIRADRIDIAVDLAVHSDGNRLDALARKPAPVQVTYLGYPGTTGMKAMDAILLDREMVVPGGAEAMCTERIWPLRSYFCFRPPAESPEVGPLPAKANGVLTFGSFNNFAKISPEVLAMWGRAVCAVPGARLVIQTAVMADSAAQAYVLKGLQAAGLSRERIELRGVMPMVEYLSALTAVDIALDAFPYNGGTTTCHALWMGVPVVSLCGRLPVGRMGRSVLSKVGLEQLAVDSADDFVVACARLAGDVEGLAGLRAGMRERMRGSALMDEAGAARDLEEAYRGMWREWCGKPESRR